ncbi:MAG: hypothetical protein M0Z53_01855 [Thermaerobacter sp.]|nr:hypothetical protein [Thermaerobacter sp.]
MFRLFPRRGILLGLIVLSMTLTGCGRGPAPAATPAIPYPSSPHWLSVWVPPTHQYVWVNPHTTPTLLVRREDLAAGRLLRRRLSRLRTASPVVVVITNPPALNTAHPPADLKPWTALAMPLGYLVGHSPPAAPVTFLAAGPHHRLEVRHQIPSLTQLAPLLHATILPATPATPPKEVSPR